MSKCAVALMLVVMVGAARADDSDTLIASVESINEADLGRPYTASFTPLTGKEAKAVFTGGKPRKTLINEWRSDFLEVDTVSALQANARAWGIGEGSLSTSAQKRYMVFRVRVVEHALEIDDTNDPRQVDGTSGAAYYVRKIYFGRMYEVVVSGTADTLNARIAPQIRLLPVDFSAEMIQRQYKLNVTLKAKGLKPNNGALFAHTTEEIKKAYDGNDMGPPVPILVEYRRIPGAKSDAPQTIDWSAPANSAPTSRVRVLTVDGKNSDWTSTGLTLSPDDFAFGEAQGNVTYTTSKWDPKPPADADAKGAGGLEMRVGTTVGPAGKAWSTKSATGGELKLRVRDSNHTDNSGSYQVTIVVVPVDTLKADCKKVEQGVATPCF